MTDRKLLRERQTKLVKEREKVREKGAQGHHRGQNERGRERELVKEIEN